VIVQPETVVRSQRNRFRRYWRQLSRPENSGGPTRDQFQDRAVGTVKTEHGRIIEIPEVGGLHHRYERRAA
jgi:hypothetical protein